MKLNRVCRASAMLLAAVLLSAGAGAGAGCAKQAAATRPTPPQGELGAEPAVVEAQTATGPAGGMVADETGAVLRRGWPVSIAQFPNGSVVAGPVYFPRADDDVLRPDWQNVPLNYLEFAGALLMLPVNMVITPPWTPVRYSGDVPNDPLIRQPGPR